MRHLAARRTIKQHKHLSSAFSWLGTRTGLALWLHYNVCRAAVPARLSLHRQRIASFATSCTSAMFGTLSPLIGVTSRLSWQGCHRPPVNLPYGFILGSSARLLAAAAHRTTVYDALSVLVAGWESNPQGHLPTLPIARPVLCLLSLSEPGPGMRLLVSFAESDSWGSTNSLDAPHRPAS